MMMISVIICTRNRASSLAQTLQSVAQLYVPAGLRWELVIVNNGSADRTSEVIRQFQHCLPIREENEATAGISNARNAGVTAARGDYLVWADDDVLVEKGWLAAYCRSFERWPEAAVFGGKILPRFEGAVPGWVTANLDVIFGPLAYRDFGDEPLPLTRDRIPFGANYAIRAAEQRAIAYDPDLGYAPGRSRLGEEVAVMGAILARGAVGQWVPDAVVFHRIPSRRLTVRYIGLHLRAHGQTAAHLELAARGQRPERPPRWLWRRMLERSVRYYAARLLCPPAIWLRMLRQYEMDRGMIEYLRCGRK